MVFKNRVDFSFLTVAILTALISLLTIVVAWMDKSQIFGFKLWLTILLLAVCGFVGWIYKETYYTLTETDFKYQSGPISGQFKISSIKELEVNKTLWLGWTSLKPATALKGIIIKYNQYDRIYISPKDNEAFVKELLDINSEIKVIRF